MELIIDDSDVYVKYDDHTKLLVQITKPKAMWYEIWFRLREVDKITE